MKARFYSLLFFVLFGLSGCIDDASKYFISGKAKFKNEEFDSSIEDLKQALAKGAPKGESAYYIAESYRQSNRLGEAEEFYKMAIKERFLDDHADFYYGHALKANKKYASAKKVFQRYIRIGSNFEYIDQAKKELKNIEALEELIKQPETYVIENCKDMNSEGLDYRPVMVKGEFYYTSTRGEGPVYTGNGERFSDIYRYRFDGASKFSGVPAPVNEIINQEKTHEADPTFSPDGRTMYFSRNSNGKKKDITQEVDIFESKFANGSWSEPKRLDFCETFSWDSNPWLSPTGDTLFFSSNRDGGEGGDDLWYVSKDFDGAWGIPENMGPKINTPGDEQFPYIGPDGVFYFSSTGHPGFGQLDLFKVVDKQVVNMGRPVNSNADDFGIFMIDKKNGYFASNREGGQGQDDIYAFKFECQRDYSLEVLVNKEVLDTNDVITGDLEPLGKVIVMLENEDGDYVDTMVTNNKGLVTFQIEPKTGYIIHTVESDFIKKDVEFNSRSITIDEETATSCEPVTAEIAVLLTEIKDSLIIEFPPILYEYNKWDILPESESILKDMAATLKDNPTILVELGSHTDARGTLKYNDILSQKRAESAVKWIIEKGGIDAKRIAAKGYGERIPRILKTDTAVFKKGDTLVEALINQFETTDTAMFELGHQLNRRTEFKVVGVIKEAVDPEHIKVIQNYEEEQNPEQDKLDNEDDIIERYLEEDETYEVEYEEGEYEEGTNQVEFEIDEEGNKKRKE